MSSSAFTLCNGIFDESDTAMLLKSLSAKYNAEKDTITIPHSEGDLVLSIEDFESILDNWIMLGPTLAGVFTAFLRIVNNEKGEAGGFVQYIKDFLTE